MEAVPGWDRDLNVGLFREGSAPLAVPPFCFAAPVPRSRLELCASLVERCEFFFFFFFCFFFFFFFFCSNSPASLILSSKSMLELLLTGSSLFYSSLHAT